MTRAEPAVKEASFLLPEAKLIQLMHHYMLMGFVYGCIADMPLGPDDYDPFDKGEGTKRWVQETAKENRKSLRRYRVKQNSKGGRP